MKRGQLLGEPFLIIFSLVVLAFIIFFGIRYIPQLLDLGCKTEFVTSAKNIEAEVQTVYNLDFGSTVRKKFDLCGIQIICFVSEGVDITKIPAELQNIVKIRKNDNVFFLGKESDSFFIDHLQPSKNPICKKILNNRVDLIFENKGMYVEVK